MRRERSSLRCFDSMTDRASVSDMNCVQLTEKSENKYIILLLIDNL